MYFDFDDYRPDTPRVLTAISWREGVLLSIIFHLVMVITLILSPKLFSDERRGARSRHRAGAAARAREHAVRVRPAAPRQGSAEAAGSRGPFGQGSHRTGAPTGSEADERVAVRARQHARARAKKSPVRSRAARARRPIRPPASRRRTRRRPPPLDSQSALQLPTTPPAGARRTARAGGLRRRADRSAMRSGICSATCRCSTTRREAAGSSGPRFSSTRKGVEFGPWIRRFVAQVKRNWFVPYSAMSMQRARRHHSSTCTRTARSPIWPSSVRARSTPSTTPRSARSRRRIRRSRCRREYPADKAFFTVTFFYNESPQ